MVSDGAALRKEELAARAFVGHKYDRARDRVYHRLLLLGAHSGHWRRRLNRDFCCIVEDQNLNAPAVKREVEKDWGR